MFEDKDSPKVDAKAAAHVAGLIKERTRDWDPSMLVDPVQTALQNVIAAKQKGKRPAKKAAAKEAQPTNVVNIMDALRNSLAAEKKHAPR